MAGIFASDGFVRGHSFEGYPVESLGAIEERLGDFLILLCFGVDDDSMLERIAQLARRHETYGAGYPGVWQRPVHPRILAGTPGTV